MPFILHRLSKFVMEQAIVWTDAYIIATDSSWQAVEPVVRIGVRASQADVMVLFENSCRSAIEPESPAQRELSSCVADLEVVL